jgi:predicted phosphodiesterase
MEQRINRRSFLRIAGTTVGIGALYQFAPALIGKAGADPISDFYRRANGESPTSFTFAQFSDTHVGFQGPPAPLGTAAFENAVKLINHAPKRPDLVLFTGDLTHDVEARDVHAQRMKQFAGIAGRIETGALHMIPGENDAALDHGVLYSEHFGATHYSFDHKGVHFIGLDNVSRGRPEIGAQQVAWLKADLARFSHTTPIIVFTHRPLFDLKPEWEWFTADGDDVMAALALYENVTILYGHIHRHDVSVHGKTSHYAARSLIFGFNDPATDMTKHPLPFDRNDPFKDLGLRLVDAKGGAESALAPTLKDVVLTKAEFAGLSGAQQMIKSDGKGGDSSEND